MGGSSSKEEARGSPQSTKKSQPQKKASISSADKVKLQLKMQKDSLRASIKKYELVGSFEHQKAKDLLQAGDKRKALYCLKCEKVQENRISKLTAMYDNIEKLLDTIQTQEVEVEVFASLKAGNVELQKLNEMLKIEEIEKIMGEAAESIEEAREIDNVLAQPIDGKYFDEDELLQMLNDNMGVTENVTTQLENAKIPKIKVKENSPSYQNERVMMPA